MNSFPLRFHQHTHTVGLCAGTHFHRQAPFPELRSRNSQGGQDFRRHHLSRRRFGGRDFRRPARDAQYAAQSRHAGKTATESL